MFDLRSDSSTVEPPVLAAFEDDRSRGYRLQRIGASWLLLPTVGLLCARRRRRRLKRTDYRRV